MSIITYIKKTDWGSSDSPVIVASFVCLMSVVNYYLLLVEKKISPFVSSLFAGLFFVQHIMGDSQYSFSLTTFRFGLKTEPQMYSRMYILSYMTL